MAAGDEKNPLNQMKLQERQNPSVGQSEPLPTERKASTIPMADFHPAHQDEAAKVWEYPSPQMFYNAMKRKGWKPEERDMTTVVAIHNQVNETAWHAVLEWEQLHPESFEQVKLARFMGRPKDRTPKAFFRELLGQEAPFDRHDWFVRRGEKEVRYVIDFYNVRSQGPDSDPVGVYIDARPALDGPVGVFDRLRMGFGNILGQGRTRFSKPFVPTAAAAIGKGGPASAAEAEQK